MLSVLKTQNLSREGAEFESGSVLIIISCGSKVSKKREKRITDYTHCIELGLIIYMSSDWRSRHLI